MYSLSMSSKRERLTEQIRRLVNESGFTKAELAKETKIDRSTLSRLCNGERFIGSADLDALADFLRLRVISDRAVKAKE